MNALAGANRIPAASRIANGSTLKAALRSALRPLLPSSWYWRWLARRVGYFDPELHLLPLLCDRDKVSIDIGASMGSYTVHLLGHSRRCVVFEPRPEAIAYLLQRLAPRPHRRLSVEPVALSDHAGEAQLRVVTEDKGRSTIEPVNTVEGATSIECVTVPVRRLDDYAARLGPVGFIKIDVEGHEEAVLLGATALLERDHPALLIEIEERHKPGAIEAVRRHLGTLGYRGFFYRGGKLHPLETFSIAVHQDVAKMGMLAGGEPVYVNNFLFAAGAPLARLEHLAGVRQTER